MKAPLQCGFFIFLFLSLVCAQSFRSPAQLQAAAVFAAMQDNAAGSSPNIQGSFPATLVKPLDSKKLKEGDMVICQTTAPLHWRGGLIPSGTRIIGHVTQATARSKGSPDSTLGIAFDRIEFPKGREILMKGTLQAIAPSLETGPTTGPATPGSLGGSGSRALSPAALSPSASDRGNNSVSGAGNSPGTTPSAATVGPASGSAAGSSKPMVTSQSQGALGMKGLELKNSVISSSGKEVKVDGGTQMLIHAEINVPAQ